MVWLDFIQRFKIDQTFQPNTLVSTGSFPVRSVIGKLKHEAVIIQAKPNTSVCELEKTYDFFFLNLAKRFNQEILQVYCSSVCVTQRACRVRLSR